MVYLYIFVMAFVTYLLRAVPLTVFRKKIEKMLNYYSVASQIVHKKF